MDLLKDILAEKGGDLVSSLVGGAGFSAEQAEAFVPEAASSVVDVVKDKAGELDFGEIAANPASLVQSVDIAGLAGKVGLGTSQTSSGLMAIVPTLIGALGDKAGGLDSLESLLGGGGDALGAVTGLAGKLFGK